MKKTQPAFNNNLQTLNLLSVQQASMIAGGSSKSEIDTSKSNTPVYATSSEPAATIPSSTGRPPFN
jgi:hypothetical protein